MQYQRINITLPRDLASDLRRTIPVRSRSKFISRALSEKLTKRKNLEKEWIKGLKASYKADKRIAKEWDATLMDGLGDLRDEEW